MTGLRAFLSRLAALVQGRQRDRDLRKQIEAHLDEATDEYLQQGLSREEARRAALQSFGGVARAEEAHRDVRSFAWLEDARRDLRYAFRSLGRTPGFTTVAILTLTLATGAATAIFSVIDAALLRPLPYDNPQELVTIRVGETADRALGPSAADIALWRESGGVFAHLGLGRLNGSRPVVVDAGTPERLIVGTASEDFLEVFGIAPVLGRGITANDRLPGAPPIVLLGHQYWQTRFDGASDVLGRSIRVNDISLNIVGVLPAGFYPDTMLWRPHITSSVMTAMRGTGVDVYGRLRPGLDIDSAARELTARLSETKTPPGTRVLLTSLYDQTTSSYRLTVGVLSGAVALIVLIACVNVAGLLLARGATRQPELAIRRSIGASRGRLVRQLLTESVVLAAAGGTGGVILAFVTLNAIVGLLPIRLPENVTPSVNLTVLASALLLSLVTSIAFGLAPALKLSRTSAHSHTAAAAGDRRHGSALTRRGGQALIAVEVALALVLVTGAVLMLRSFSKISAIDVGFDPAAIVTMDVLPLGASPTDHESYYATLLQNVRQIPGVSVVGAADRPPLDGSGSYTDATANQLSKTVALRSVMPGYFEAIGLPLRQGRFPTGADYNTGPPFAVLSEFAARTFFPNQSAVGQSLLLHDQAWTVVGVVGDARNKSPLLADLVRPDVYLARQPNERSSRGAGLTLVVRPVGPAPRLAGDLRRAAYAVGPPVIVGNIRSGRAWFSERVATPRQQTTMLSLLGGLGLLLTIVGIVGTTAYAVARRTQEVGIRMALGAQPRQMVRAIVRDAAGPVAIGIAIGLTGAVAVTRVIAGFLFETEPTDPLALVTAIVVIAVAALAAAWVPGRRAARVDPVTALRAG